MNITPDQIEREEFTNVPTCFKCYKLNDHPTKDCCEVTTTRCSECSEDGHRLTECWNPVKKVFKLLWPSPNSCDGLPCKKKDKIKQIKEQKEREEREKK